MLEVSRYAFAAGEENSSVVQRGRVISTVTLDPCGDRFEQLLCRLWLRHRISVWGPAGGGGVWLHALGDSARIVPRQPNEAMARMAPRSPVVPAVNNKV
jgi:hypothetical protein